MTAKLSFDYIRHSLDQQENAELSTGQQSRDSNNADGTGFFSLAVLENVRLDIGRFRHRGLLDGVFGLPRLCGYLTWNW